MKLPHESSETVKAILEKEISNKEKAELIYKYSAYRFKKRKGPRGIGGPRLSEKDIEKILFDRELEQVHNRR